MPTVTFTTELRQHLDGANAVDIEAATVREALERVVESHPRLRPQVFDAGGRLWPHVTVFVDDALVADRDGLSDPVSPDAELHLMQSLSGG